MTSQGGPQLRQRHAVKSSLRVDCRGAQQLPVMRPPFTFGHPVHGSVLSLNVHDPLPVTSHGSVLSLNVHDPLPITSPWLSVESQYTWSPPCPTWAPSWRFSIQQRVLPSQGPMLQLHGLQSFSAAYCGLVSSCPFMCTCQAQGCCCRQWWVSSLLVSYSGLSILSLSSQILVHSPWQLSSTQVQLTIRHVFPCHAAKAVGMISLQAMEQAADLVPARFNRWQFMWNN